MEPPPNPNPKPIPAVLLPLTFGVLNPNPLLKSPPKADTREYYRYEGTEVTIFGNTRHQCARPHPSAREGYNYYITCYLGNIMVEERYGKHS